MRQTVAATLYTLRDQVSTTEGFTDALRRLKEMGVDTIQYSGVAAPLTAREVRDVCDELSMSICLTHVPWERLKTDLDTLAEEHLIMGCSVMGLSHYPENNLSAGDEIKAFISDIQGISRRLRTYGLKFAMHNHINEFHRYDGKPVLQLLAEQTDPEETEIIFCCCWAQTAGADPAQWLYKLKGRVTRCHYKDWVMIDGQATTAEVGYGNMNYPAIFEACEKTGVQYAIIEQDTCRRDPFACIKDSREYILGLGEKQ